MKQISYIPNFEEWKKEFLIIFLLKFVFLKRICLDTLTMYSTFIYFEEARTSFIRENKIFGELTGPIEKFQWSVI